jgi:hypothetical protein
MKGFDYATLLELDRTSSLRGKYFSLRFGPWELRGMPFVTIATLAEDRALLHEIVGRCFVNRPVLWSDLDSESCRHCVRALTDLRYLLEEVESRLEAAHHSRDLVYAGIVTRWLEATTDAVEALEALEGGGEGRDEAARDLLAGYRARVYGPVSALIQFLPRDDEWAEEARATYARGRDALAAGTGGFVKALDEACWLAVEPEEAKDSLAEGEPRSVTWGIP